MNNTTPREKPDDGALLPCPFCNTVGVEGVLLNGWHVAQCLNCGAHGAYGGHTTKSAITAWNARATPTGLQESHDKLVEAVTIGIALARDNAQHLQQMATLIEKKDQPNPARLAALQIYEQSNIMEAALAVAQQRGR